LQRAFKCSAATVRGAVANGRNEPKQRGRHAAIDAESEADIVNWIGKHYDKSHPVTRTEIRHYCIAKCEIPATRGWVDSFLLRHQNELIETKSLPQEEPRLQIPRAFLDQTVQAMDEAVRDRPADLVFNLDEVGISDWEDRKSKKVVVPRTAATQTVHHGISRSLKHLSIITCISAGGACLSRYMLSSQATGPVIRSLERTGVRFGRDLVLTQRSKAYINGSLFADYIRKVFLPHLTRVRTEENLLEEEATLLMDNCPAHLTQEVLGLLNDARVRIVTFAPHTTHLFQVLDLTLFGALKRRRQYELPFDTDHRAAGFIQNVYHSFRETMTDPKIRAAFTHIGITFARVGAVVRVGFDEIILRDSSGFQELWAIDFPRESLSAQRRNSSFGWINKQE
jgi:hypothetical protein